MAKYLNENFISYETLLAENFYKTENFQSEKIYNDLINYSDTFSWYSSKQLAKILIEEKNKDAAIKLTKSYSNLINQEIYETFDYAEFLKNNENLKESFLFTLK